MEQLLNLMPWIWSAIIIITLIIELFSSDIDAIWISVGGAASLALSIFDVHLAIQLSIFVATSIILLFTIGKWIKKRSLTKHLSANSDSLIGKEILVIEDVNEFNKGSGVINDIVWTISCQAGISIKKGKHAIIVAIDENHLVVTSK